MINSVIWDYLIKISISKALNKKNNMYILKELNSAQLLSYGSYKI